MEYQSKRLRVYKKAIFNSNLQFKRFNMNRFIIMFLCSSTFNYHFIGYLYTKHTERFRSNAQVITVHNCQNIHLLWGLLIIKTLHEAE